MTAANGDHLIHQTLAAKLRPEQPGKAVGTPPATDQRPKYLPRRFIPRPFSVVVPQMNRAEHCHLHPHKSPHFY
jgi:hypothetical protein